MFLSGVLFVLFLAGCWVYCLTDAALTPAAEFPRFRKPIWITAIAVTFIVGAIAWVIARMMWRAGYWPRTSAGHPGFHHAADALLAAEALARHPATRSKNTSERAVPVGPDDDHEFLRELAERIRGEQ